MSDLTGSVLVGADGSPSSEAAIDWAAEEAVRHGWGLHLLFAYTITEPYGVMMDGPDGATPVPFFLQDAQARVLARWHDVPVTLEVVREPVVPALLGRAQTASMTVVGARGHSIAARLSLGSVSRHVGSHAPGPVVVVHPRAASAARDVVCGIDDSAHAAEVLRVAGLEAALRERRLVVFHAWDLPTADPYGAWVVPDDVGESLAREAKAMAVDAVAALAAEMPHLDTEVVVQRGHPVTVALTMAETAELLVVGRHGVGHFPGMLTGSVAATAMASAACPVLVVPHA